MPYKKDDRLEQIFSQKRIAVVGPSPHLLDCNLGRYIDMCDVVCRLNDVLPKNHQFDYGTKTDVVFYTCSSFSLEWFTEEMDNSGISNQIKMVYCPVLKASHQDRIESKEQYTVEKNFNSINKWGVEFGHIGYENYKHFYNTIGVEPNTGMLAICSILQYDIKELFIGGVSFYLTGNTYETSYYPNHFQEKYREKNNDFNPWVGHDQGRQLDYFLKNILIDKRVKIDHVLENMLRSRHLI